MRFLPIRLFLASSCLLMALSPAIARDNKDPTDRARNTRIQEALKISKTKLIRRTLSDHQHLLHRSSSSSRSAASLRKIANRSVSKKPARIRKN
jgi:hypothetical protein